MKEIQQQALAHLGIAALTPMQEAMFYAAREPQDVVLLSPTGSGKTVAYLLPLIEKFTTLTPNPSPLTPNPLSIVVVPSRELALQIESVFKQMNTSWRAMAVYGGRPTMDEHRTMRDMHPTLIVGTPGRLNDHLQKGNIDATAVCTLVLDEFDKCLELGFHDEMQSLLERLPRLQQRWYISATDTPEMPEFIGLHRHVRLDYRGGDSRIETYVVPSPDKDKLPTLYRLLCALDGSQAIVFVGYRESAERIGSYLREQCLVHAVYHGGLEQDLRERALYKFRNGSVNVLVSTDLASRGLDIPEVHHIIHYHLPANAEAAIHRTGRTARWDASGNSYYILGPTEHLPAWLPESIASPATPEASATSQTLETTKTSVNPVLSSLETFGSPANSSIFGGSAIPEFPLPEITRRPTPPAWETLYIGKGKKDKLNRIDIAGFLYKKGNLTSADVGRIDVLDHYAYAAVRRSKVRQLLSLVSGEKIKGMKTIIEIAR